MLYRKGIGDSGCTLFEEEFECDIFVQSWYRWRRSPHDDDLNIEETSQDGMLEFEKFLPIW